MQAGVPNLLFSPADIDLHDFLQLESRMAGFEENAMFVNGMHGISSGLAYLHNFQPRFQGPSNPKASMYGSHHDIKPRNVLITANKFVLADFGLARLKTLEENTKTDWKDTTYEYGAPECRDPNTFTPGKVGRALDIWSLACIFAEVTVYLEKGTSGIRTFRDCRLFNNVYGTTRCFHDNKALIPKVDSYLGSLVELASFQLTSELIELVREMFASYPQSRPNAPKVETEMARLCIKAFMYSLRRIIDNRLEEAIGLNISKVFKARLILEKNRHLAWAGVIGLIPVKGHDYIFKHDTLAFFPAIVSVLQSAINKLNTFPHFDSVEDDHDFMTSTLYDTNNSLCSHLPGHVRTSVDGVFAILSTMTTELQSLKSVGSASTAENTAEYKDIGAVAAMKYMSILLSSHPQSIGVTRPLDPTLIRRDMHKQEFEEAPQTFWYSYGYQPGEERKVLIERKGYGKKWTKDIKGKEFEKIGESLFLRIQELVEMLRITPKPSNFRVLDCLGTFHDTKRHEFGIVYTFPSENQAPVRLHRLLRRKGVQAVYPDPSQKLALAKALVTSVHSFHVSGWIHKDLNSYNILFFCEPERTWEHLDYGKPYIVGFNHSR